jgi:hypothetical protein
MNTQPKAVTWNPWSPWYSDEDDRARWHGLFIRTYELSDGSWWWVVYDMETGKQLESSNEKPGGPTTRAEARKCAEDAARRCIEAKYLSLFSSIVKWDKAYH